MFTLGAAGFGMVLSLTQVQALFGVSAAGTGSGGAAQAHQY